MTYLFFPGRHLLTTSFQESYLWDILRLPIGKLDCLGSYSLPDDKISHIVFGVTSANQSNSRYNPIPFYERAIGLDRFARIYKESIGISYSIVGIPHYNPNEKFASYCIKEAEIDLGISMTPENTIVLCSTPALIKQYQLLGYTILAAEYDSQKELVHAPTPVDVLKVLVSSPSDWNNNQVLEGLLSKSNKQLWNDFPSIPKTIIALWSDPLLTDTGSLTVDRNYHTYAHDMAVDTLLDMKYQDIKDAIVEGKIVDEGCADGALLVKLAHDFPDSDLIGIELTTEFTARCMERLRAGLFGGAFVHFYQRNLLDRIFSDNTIDTTICNSTTHELWSYGNRRESLVGYLEKKYAQTRPHGRIIIRDVVGPEDKEQEVYLWTNDTNGSNDEPLKFCENKQELHDHLAQLSTYGRFIRFAEEYLKDMRDNGKRDNNTKIIYREESIDGKKYIVTKLKDAVEFMTKKDYIDNWNSELNEEFAYWSFSEWKQSLKDVGFSLVENPNHEAGTTRLYVSDWIVKNRFEGSVALYKETPTGLDQLPWPPTHMVLVGQK